MEDVKTPLRHQRGQTLPVVLIIGAVLSMLALGLLKLFQYEVKFMVKNDCMMKKQELASIALEHAIYKLQQGGNWNAASLEDFTGYSRAFKTGAGTYAFDVENGNLFTSGGVRQDPLNYKTIGIKVTTTPTGCTGAYVAVIKRTAFGGPLVSKGFINLPCTEDDSYDQSVTNKLYFNFGFYWGDVYSANKSDGKCRMPQVPVGGGDVKPQPWMPNVFAAGNIYTCLDKDFNFGYTYHDSSPTAHCHPYSEFAQAPDLDLEYFKMLAKQQGSYYGPANVNGSVNPFFINDGAHDIDDVTQANIAVLVGKLTGLSSVLFIDTTDGLPLRYDAASGKWNSYTGYQHVSMSANTIRFYKDQDNQYFTRGMLFVQGPFSISGSNPEKGMGGVSNCDDITGITYPDNYYYPRQTDEHFTLGSPATNSKLTDVKHRGLIYSGGELMIGGGTGVCAWKLRLWPPPFLYYDCSYTTASKSNVAIFGTVFIGENGILSADTANDDPEFHVYYDNSMNVFGSTGSMITVATFTELTFLIPK